MKQALIWATALMALQACGSSDTAPTGAFAIRPSDTLAGRLDGQPLPFAGLTMRQNLAAGGVARTSDPVTITYDRATQIVTMHVGENGDSFDLNGLDGSNIGASYADKPATGPLSGLSIFYQSFAELESGEGNSRYHLPVRSYAFGPFGDTIHRAYGVIGLETRPDNLPPMDFAEYGGRFFLNNFVADTADNFDRTDYYGWVSLSFDFDRGAVIEGSLEIDSRTIGLGPNETATGSLALGSGAISGGRYAVLVSGRLDDTELQPGSRLEGAFFGPNAEETGGAIHLTGTDPDGTEREAFGGFGAIREN